MKGGKGGGVILGRREGIRSRCQKSKAKNVQCRSVSLTFVPAVQELMRRRRKAGYMHGSLRVEGACWPRLREYLNSPRSRLPGNHGV